MNCTVVDELLSPMRQNFHQSRDGASDDPHQNLIVIHSQILSRSTREMSTKKAPFRRIKDRGWSLSTVYLVAI